MQKAAAKFWIGMLVFFGLLSGMAAPVRAEGEALITAPHGVLMEASTGTVLYEKEKDTKVKPASITKIMTLILIFDELEKGSLHMEDPVVTSAYAKSMGGSQVFLEEGEKQTVETLIKCIVIASGNDASVAMAEHIAGSEGEFVRRMNERAAGLGMENTHFEDCCGLTESDNHYTSAYDVALMSRELVTRYPKILEYSSVWMDTITHVTDKGSSEFGLTNTNKLIRSYDGCVGLKTGSTSAAKYCVSAVAQRNGITLISVVMTAPDYKVRFQDAAAMLNLGGSVLGFASADSSSAAKGESVADTIRIISCYADICAMRHPKEGAPLVASQFSSIPVINAGDGGHQHPTQTLTDLLTIRSLTGRLNNLTVGLCGDLKFGRTVHSLIEALVRYTGIRFVLISPQELRIPDYIRTDVLDKKGVEYREVDNLDEAMPELDILYMTRVQKERFFNEEDYIRLKDSYILDNKKMELAKETMYVLHPLPRVNEISVEVDKDPRAAYFKQAQYGVYVRMALIMTLLEVEKPC